jgi:hypothetical protein
VVQTHVSETIRPNKIIHLVHKQSFYLQNMMSIIEDDLKLLVFVLCSDSPTIS